MAITDRLRIKAARWLLKGIKAAEAWGPEWLNASFFEPTFQAIVREGYRANGIVLTCVTELALAFSEPKLRIYRDTGAGPDAILEHHPVLSLIRNPHAQISRSELLSLTMCYLALGGNAYWYKLRNGRRVVGLIPLSPAQLEPVPGGTKLVSHYERRDLPADASPAQKRIRVEDIIHFKWLPDPLRPWLGLAPLVSVAREIDTDNEMTRYLFALLKNEAIPRLMFTGPEGVPIDTDMLREQWQEQYSGDRRGKVAFLEGGIVPHRLSLDLHELAFEALRRVPESRICAALRVPPVIAGVNVGLEQMTYNNVANMRKRFAQDTMARIWSTFSETLTRQLLIPDFGADEGEVIGFDLNTVTALQEDRNALRVWANDAFSRGGIKLNEYRHYVGLPNDPNGDVYLYEMPIARGSKRMMVVDGKMLQVLRARQLDAGQQKRLALPDEVVINRAEVDEAIERWDLEMPEYEGLLDAEVAHDEQE